MAKAKRYRWQCPQCKKSVLGGSRPRKDSIVRFCLPCSKKTGYLVERSCPTLEAKRQLKKAAAKEKAERVKTKKCKKEDETKYLYCGWDLREELKRLVWVATKLGYDCSLTADDMTVSWRKKGEYTTGRAWQDRIHLTLYEHCTPAKAIAVLAHEVAHSATPDDAHHSFVWQKCFLALVEETYKHSNVRVTEPITGKYNRFQIHKAVIKALWHLDKSKMPELGEAE